VTLVVVTFESVPQAVPLHPAPESDQFTPLFWESFCNVAVKLCVAPVTTLGAVGDTVTEMPAAAERVIVAAALLLPSRLDAAVSVTLAGLGSETGAV